MRPEREVARALKDARDRLFTARRAGDGTRIAAARRDFNAALDEARAMLATREAARC